MPRRQTKTKTASGVIFAPKQGKPNNARQPNDSIDSKPRSNNKPTALDSISNGPESAGSKLNVYNVLREERHIGQAKNGIPNGIAIAGRDSLHQSARRGRHPVKGSGESIGSKLTTRITLIANLPHTKPRISE
jgi:hypothetical protein